MSTVAAPPSRPAAAPPSESLGAPGGSGFVASPDGARWLASGGITFANAGEVLEASRALPLPGEGIVDCAALHPVDSAGVAVLLAIKRRALVEERRLAFDNITPSLHTLADLYGVEELLST